MKITFTSLIFLFVHFTVHCCSFTVIPFCNTVTEENPNNIILRGYFTEELSNGLVFVRLETLKGNEDRTEINVWDNSTFDCNGPHERKAIQMGDINQEIIISLTYIDSLNADYENLGDYRVPEGLWWETHSLQVEGDSVNGFYLFSQEQGQKWISIHYDEFIETVINNNQCVSTSTTNTKAQPISIYPTLVNENILIDYNSFHNHSKIYLYNSIGQQIINEQLSNYLYVGTLPSGMYVVVVEDKDKKCYHQKIVKI